GGRRRGGGRLRKARVSRGERCRPRGGGGSRRGWPWRHPRAPRRACGRGGRRRAAHPPAAPRARTPGRRSGRSGPVRSAGRSSLRSHLNTTTNCCRPSRDGPVVRCQRSPRARVVSGVTVCSPVLVLPTRPTRPDLGPRRRVLRGTVPGSSYDRRVPPKSTATAAQYTARHLSVLEGLEAVRKRPGMYIGSTDSRRLMHRLWEIIDNAVDEALEGHGDAIEIVLHPDSSVEVRDNGRGIPVDTVDSVGLSGVEVVFTKLHAGGKFGNGSYAASGGLHGVGASV